MFFLLAHIYSSPAAWAKDLSSEACFRSIASFGDTHYLSRTSPHSIQCAWNPRMWNFEFRKTLLPPRNLWNFAPCKRFRPVWKRDVDRYEIWPPDCEPKSTLEILCKHLTDHAAVTIPSRFFKIVGQTTHPLFFGVEPAKLEPWPGLTLQK